MPSAAYNLDRKGFLNSRAQHPAVFICNGEEAIGTATGIESKRTLELATLMPEALSTGTLLVEDFERLAVTDRSLISVDGVSMQVFAITGSASDPTRKMLLRLAQTAVSYFE